MKREELLKSEGYWIAKIQTDLYREITAYLKRTHKTATQFAKELGCSKGYVSQLLNGNYDHKLSKLVELSLAMGKVPVIEYKDITSFLREDEGKSPSESVLSIEEIIEHHLHATEELQRP